MSPHAPVFYDPVTEYPHEVLDGRDSDYENCEKMRRHLAAAPAHRGFVRAYNEREAAMFAAFFTEEENARISYSWYAWSTADGGKAT